MLYLYIKISTLILLPWMFHFYNNVSSLNKYYNEKCNLRRKLNTRNYRLLEENKQNKDTFIVNFKEVMPHKGVKQKGCLSNNKNRINRKQKQLCRSSLYTEKYSKNVEKYKCCTPKTKKYCEYEKKIFKKLDYKDYVKNIKIIDDKEYKKLSCKKRRIRITLLLLFFLVLIFPILDLSLEKLECGGLLGLLGLLYPTKTEASSPGGMIVHGIDGLLIKWFSINDWGASKAISTLNVLIYCIPFLIFIVIFILGMIYYYKKVIKYENIKFKKKIK
ncbi:fam-l protein [Plasmodium malariae]|uniref:Fam-l protein n=1 Tax=Plasmodium malariae TaxID=5858 RepID=A0A1D3TDN5_PLAMA|nr:fam-l protein [Plasmodium malariae]SCP03021.1 fam-l protein [Plasmodium malariae]